MFARSYWPAAYWPAGYWPQAAEAEVVESTARGSRQFREQRKQRQRIAQLIPQAELDERERLRIVRLGPPLMRFPEPVALPELEQAPVTAAIRDALAPRSGLAPRTPLEPGAMPAPAPIGGAGPATAKAKAPEISQPGSTLDEELMLLYLAAA